MTDTQKPAERTSLVDTVETGHLLEQMEALEKVKQNTIKSLLHERETLEKKTAARIVEITSALKVLGYHKPRAKKAEKAAKP